MGAFVTRFAPSPTGQLHLGHAYSALTAYSAATAAGGRFILRIEDIDRQRCRPAFEQAIYDDLSWLGLSWETPVRRQSEHMSDYAQALLSLRSKNLLYRCFRTRKDVLTEIARAPHPGDQPLAPPFRSGPLDPDEERGRLSNGEGFAWRLSMEKAKAYLGSIWGQLKVEELDRQAVLGGDRVTTPFAPRPDDTDDPILARKELDVAYHLACVVDDARQGVSHVIRGEDLRPALDVHRVLQALLGLPTPIYHHHPLIFGADGRRLAKRAGSKSLGDLRADGEDPGQIRRDLGFSSAGL